MSDKPVIFISFSHKDEPEPPAPGEIAWVTFVQSFLQPLVVAVGVFDVWVDFHLHGGDKIDPEIEKKLATCDIFLLLVSRHSLSSVYVVKTEIATIHQRQENGEDVRIFPIAISPVPDAALALLKGLLLKPDIKRPLSAMPLDEREKVMAKIADDIAAIATEMAEKKKERLRLALEAGQRQEQQRIGGLFKTVLVPQVQRQARLPPDLVEISDLPKTGYEHLRGRDAELAKLDAAWRDPKNNIISLVAEGGAGKSALATEWLKRLEEDNFGGARVVLGWSFYSQGTKERATSAEGFLSWAIEKLGIQIETTSATAKGEAIAEELTRRRILLVLDGVEPLQHGPGPQVGQLKDLGLRALLRRFAAATVDEPYHLIMLTSRLAVSDIARWKDAAARVEPVEELSDKAGADLLRDNGVWGTDKELRTASHDFGGHPLGLQLLASYLTEKHFGDVRRRDHIRAFVPDPDNPRHDHARRVMESYEKEWLANQPVLLAIMYMIGLFDRPASDDCLRALRKRPVIEGLTDHLVNLDDDEWHEKVARLREVRLLAKVDPSELNALDAHPLVREWFGERLKSRNERGWREAHSRLYEHMRETTNEGKTPTLRDLAPLYQAISHGCRALRHQEALNKIYVDRICRMRSDGRGIEFYSRNVLGAFGSDLAALSWFFDDPYRVPTETLTETEQSWILTDAAGCLRGQGRFAETLSGYVAGITRHKRAGYVENAAYAASNLSDVQLLLGQVDAAGETARQAISLADRGDNEFYKMWFRITYACALGAAGSDDEAAKLFEDCERRQRELQPQIPFLYSAQGFRLWDFLIGQGRLEIVRELATQAAVIARSYNHPADIGLNSLTIARTLHAGVCVRSDRGNPSVRVDMESIIEKLSEALEMLGGAGWNELVPRGLLAHAAFRRSTGDWNGVMRDLDEVEEITEPGPMRLFLCDIALERARLAFAQIEAFAPLYGILEKDNSLELEVPSAKKITELKQEAEKQIKIADDYIQSCGYHRRDEELVELKEVLAGKKKFAELPPRV